MKFEKTEVWGFEHAIRGMRNPLESWDKSDSLRVNCDDGCFGCSYEMRCSDACNLQYYIGKNDIELMQKLIRAGSEHRKFMRQIMLSVDITAPLYFYKEFSTYKIGTVANSTSTMHKLASTEITKDCFEMGDFEIIPVDERSNNERFWSILIEKLEFLRVMYNETKDKRYWKELIRLLPESWLQTCTITLNYENLLSMIHQRKNHKLTEWSVDFINWVKTLPYANELLFMEKE